MKRRGITRRLHPERGLNDAANAFSSSPSPSLKALSRLVQTTIPGAPAPAVTNGWMDTVAFTDLWHDVCSRICRGRQPSHSVEPRFVEDLITHLALQPEDVFYVLGSGTGAVALQVAAQTGCRVVGVEGNKDEHNAAVARQQAFKAKVAQGKRYKHARAELLCVDVLESVPAGLGEATVVFVNNLTLSPVQNQRVRRMIVFNLPHGPTRVVSLQELGYSKTLGPCQRIDSPAEAVSWTKESVPYYLYHANKSALPPQPGEKEDSRRKTSYTALEAIGGGGDEKREAAAELQLDLDALLAEYESKDDYSSRKSRNRGPKEQEGEGEEDNDKEEEEKESDDESDGEIDYEKEIERSREELAARKELYRQLCAIERQNQMRCIELSEQSRANGNDVAQYDAAIDKAMTMFPPGGPTVEDLAFVAEMVRYRAKVRQRINEAASRELEEKLERERLAKRARIVAEEAEAERARQEKVKQLRERKKRAKVERREKKRLAKERHEAEVRERERREQERLERGRLAAERHEAERLAQERLQRERLEREQREQRERELAETERQEAARMEKERMMEVQERARGQKRVVKRRLEAERRDMEEEAMAEDQRVTEEALAKKKRKRREETSPAKPTRAATDRRKRRKMRSNDTTANDASVDDADHEAQEVIAEAQEEAKASEVAAGEEPDGASRDEDQEEEEEEEQSAGDGPKPRRRRGPTRQAKRRNSTPASAGGADREKEKEKETSRGKRVPAEKKEKEQSKKSTKKHSAKKKKKKKDDDDDEGKKKKKKKTKTKTTKKKKEEEEVEEEEFVYKVERIVAERKRHGRVEYLLKWLGYPEEENSWEPKRNLRDADGTLMATFRREQKEQLLKQQQQQQEEKKT